MPATEQTWRNQKTLHVVFAVSTLVMAIATAWMMADDHMREWKSWQLKDRKKDAWMLASRRDSLAQQYQGRMDEYESDIRRFDSEAVDPNIVKAFKQLIADEDARLERAASSDPLAADEIADQTPATIDDDEFADLNELDQELAKAAAAAAEARTTADGDDANDAARTALRDAEDAAIDARRRLFKEMDKYIREARRRENAAVSEKKSVNGVRTAKVSELGIKTGENAPRRTLDAIQEEIRELDARLERLTAQIAAAKDYRLGLEGLVAEAEAEKTELVKEVDSMKTELALLDEQVYKNTSNVGEWITRWPVLNALYSGNVRIDQNWLPDLTINYNFAQVARFDRCTTCHRAISTTAPGAATDPLYPTLPEEQRKLTFQLPTPDEAPSATAAEGEDDPLIAAYGLSLSETGIIDEADVTIHYVLPETPAARAGLQAGDVLLSIGGEPMYDPATARTRLLTLVPWASTVAVEVRRGLDHPFTAHPRLDLYLSDLSPHPQKVVGCTICHDGQGSGTEFPWTSHTPNDAHQQDKWTQEHGWFDNHHWIFPMKPARFVESNCLKCHHQKGGLEPSERFPEPPAPKLVKGWTVIEEYGCFGCHEINGFDSPTATVGPDLRLEPAFHEAAAQILRDENLNEEERQFAQALVERPDDAEARHMLFASIKRDELLATDPEAETEARLSAETHKLGNVLKDVEIPGRMRKVGPSLRYLNSKVDYEWLLAWIRKPEDFRPTTRMPQFFQQYEHLTEADDAVELKESLRFEPIEIRALAEYLLDESDDFEYLAPAEGVTEQASAERGRWLFESRGCLACHSHDEFPEAKEKIDATQGPDLSRLGAKLNTEKGRGWLYSWLKQPNRYHVRTKMPDLYLDPIQVKDAQGKPTGAVTDPAADIAAFLLGVETDWQPTDVPVRDQWSEQDRKDLADLAELWLKSDAIPAARARKYLQEGIPESQSAKLKADELLLVGITDENRVERQLEFVARRTIGKYGCFGCHDIPGFEDAKPIGTALVDWGRKETSKLAFENIHLFLETHSLAPEAPDRGAIERALAAADKSPPAAEGGSESPQAGDVEPGAPAPHAGHLDPGNFTSPYDYSYFVQALNSHGRDGFLWQKLRYPRSYDYKTTRNKNFNERLRMPRFPFADEPEELEEVMTFVLGLVKEPPAPKYLYKPDARQQAIVDGREVLERFNCAGCHTLMMEQWELAYDEDTFGSPTVNPDFPFLAPTYSDQEIAASMAKDYRGFLHASVHGEPVIDEATGEKSWVDEDFSPITPEELREAEAEEGEAIPVFYRFTLWRDALLNGEPWLRGVSELLIPANRETYGPAGGKAYPAWGGDLARYLLPKVVEHARAEGSQANPREAWGWLPPPLMDEGRKVQTDWLHGFLMDPTALRPAVVLRMPNFHMSSDEAAKLVDYFAAASGATFPYEYRPQQQSSYLAQARQQRENPLGDALNIVVNGNYCVKCHSVGDFSPEGDAYTFGPSLSDVYRRLRPTFTRDWVANPARILPYTGMPVNIPFLPDDPNLGGVPQNVYHGTSLEQLTGIVDLLMNFDAYAKGQTSVTPLVQAAAAAQGPAPAAGENEPDQTNQ
jgi:cytochrome c551/c552